jgi:hypothetical protein
VEAVEQHQAVLAGALSTQVERLLSAGDVWQPIRDGLVAWCRSYLLPHAEAEERTLYPAAGDFVRAAATVSALRTFFDSHLSKENDQLLPSLAQAPDVDLAGLLDGMHDLGRRDTSPMRPMAGAVAMSAAAARSARGYPQFDARVGPHAIRHATIFGALEAVGPGAGLSTLAHRRETSDT